MSTASMSTLDYLAAVDGFTRIKSSSDWQLNPTDELNFQQKMFMAMCAENPKIRPVLDGDIFNIIVWGWKAFINSPAVRSFKEHLPPQGCDLIVGNHEGRSDWVERIFADCNTVRIVKKLDLRLGRYKWHFEHGDRWSVNWGPFRWLYQWFAETMAMISRRLWLRICRWRGWSKSHLLDSPEARESEGYSKATLLCWVRAANWGARNKTNPVIGHTHAAAVIPFPWMTVVDNGDMERDNYYIDFTEKGAEKKSVV